MKDDFAIFSESYHISQLNWKTRYTPSLEDIHNGSLILQNEVNKSQNIKNIESYKGQVFWYINVQNQKILWINFLSKSLNYENWKKDLVIVFDWWNQFFNVKINLNTKEVFDLHVNGES